MTQVLYEAHGALSPHRAAGAGYEQGHAAIGSEQPCSGRQRQRGGPQLQVWLGQGVPQHPCHLSLANLSAYS